MSAKRPRPGEDVVGKLSQPSVPKKQRKGACEAPSTHEGAVGGKVEEHSVGAPTNTIKEETINEEEVYCVNEECAVRVPANGLGACPSCVLAWEDAARRGKKLGYGKCEGTCGKFTDEGPFVLGEPLDAPQCDDCFRKCEHHAHQGEWVALADTPSCVHEGCRDEPYFCVDHVARCFKCEEAYCADHVAIGEQPCMLMCRKGCAPHSIPYLCRDCADNLGYKFDEARKCWECPCEPGTKQPFGLYF